MEALQILGWIYLGVCLGSIGGVLGLGLFQVGKTADLKETIQDLRIQRQLLKDEIFRMSKRGKPAPRKRKYWKKKHFVAWVTFKRAAQMCALLRPRIVTCR